MDYCDEVKCMGFFSQKEAKEAQEPSRAPRCEMCELLLCTYVTSLEQQLQIALWIDRSYRFGTPEMLNQAMAKLEEHKVQVEVSWNNFRSHSAEHSNC